MTGKALRVYSVEEMISIISEFKEMTGCKDVRIERVDKNYSILYIDGNFVVKTHKTACFDFLKFAMYVIETYCKNK